MTTTQELTSTRSQLVALRDAALEAGDRYRFEMACRHLEIIDERLIGVAA